MVSSIAMSLQKGKLLSCFGFHRAPRSYHHVRGTGIGRRIAGSAVKYVGTALINKLANAIAGEGVHHRRIHRTVHRAGSYKVTGAGYRRKRAPVRSLRCGYRKRKSTVRRVHPTIGGYKRHVIRKPRANLIRRRRPTVHRRQMILI